MAQTHRKLPTLSPQDIERFWKKINKDGPIPAHCPELGPCWPWTAGVTTSGYGKFWAGNLTLTASRVMYFLIHNIDPDNLNVLHRCDNPPCCNNAHFFLGTLRDNIDDMVAKGRSLKGDRNYRRLHPERYPTGDQSYQRLHPEWVLRGEQMTCARTTEATVRAMRQRFIPHKVTIKMIAKEFNMPYARAAKILYRETWKHVL
jgi:hypothetical protein